MNMNNPMVVTNLRIPQEDWMRVKAGAAQLGISANTYINNIIDEATRREFFAYTQPSPSSHKKGSRFYESLWDVIEKSAKNKPMGASEEDKIIYNA